MMILALLLALPAITVAQIVPTAPEEGQVFYTGQDCSISWTADAAPDGWKLMRIDLIFGDQPDASVIINVAESVDSTATTSLLWTCPAVDFDGPSYHYLFSSLEISGSVVLSNQFTITSFNGTVDIPSTDATVTSSAPDATQVADPSNGAANLANPAGAHIDPPDQWNGEELQEVIDPGLGGADNINPYDPLANLAEDALDDTPFAQEFRAEAASASALLEAPSAAATQTPRANGAQFGGNANVAVEASATTPPPSTSSRMVVVYSSSNASTSAPTNSNRTSTDDSFRQTSSLQGVVGAFLFAICLGHFVI